MLRKRSRSHQKDQHMGHPTCPESCFQFNVLGPKPKTNSYFNVPGLYVAFNPKASESDSVRSPTSPLDFRVFSNLVHPMKSPNSPCEGHQKSWDCCKVGLGIIDSLDDDSNQSGKILRSLDSKNILFGPQMKTKTPFFRSRIDSFDAPKSLPKNYGVVPYSHTKLTNSEIGNPDMLFDIGKTGFEPELFGPLSHSLDSGRSLSHIANLTNFNTNSSPGNFGPGNEKQLTEGSPNFGNPLAAKLSSIPISTGSACDFIGSLSASEIELSEDYTCVKTYGPNPKTTHIFCDCVLKCHNNLDDVSKKEEEELQIELPPAMETKCPQVLASYPSSDFLSFCYSCKKQLEGKDIYMYRGEKAFCSWDCRSQEILVEEATEKRGNSSPENPDTSINCEELGETSMFFAIPMTNEII